MDAGAKTGCSSSDCEGEEQEEPSFDDEYDGHEAAAASFEDNKEQINSGEKDLFGFRQQWQKELDALAASTDDVKQDEDLQPTDGQDMGQGQVCERGEARRGSSSEGEDELAVFRQQWRRELDAPPEPALPAPIPQDEHETDLEKAKKWFLMGAELERAGKTYEAIQHYKRAMNLVPDIERRIYDSTKGTETPKEEAEEVEEEIPVNTNTDSESDEEMVEGEEVVSRLLRIQTRKGLFISPEHPTKSTHMCALPYEVLQTVLRWVVSAELDCSSLEAAGAVCRALHLAARDQDLWRCVCVRTWGIECGSPRERGFTSWRAMYLLRPRLLVHGCYISKTTYLRVGENNFQDQFYQPWYLIEYYRYLRFFPEGQVLMWTTAEEPATCVRELRWRSVRPTTGILSGHYRLIGNKVVIVVKRGNDKKPAAASNTRFRARRKEPEQDHTQTFHVELELRSVKNRRNAVLAWARYRTARRDVWTNFDLTPKAFPSFAFSRVKAYTREAMAPL